MDPVNESSGKAGMYRSDPGVDHFLFIIEYSYFISPFLSLLSPMPDSLNHINVLYAGALAAMCCRYVGVRSGLPGHDDVLYFMKRHGNLKIGKLV